MEDPFQNLKLQSQAEIWVSSKKKFRRQLILGGIFVVFLFLFFLVGYFWWQYQTTDQLINLAPVDSVLYVSARNSIWPWSVLSLGGQKRQISNLPFANFFNQVQESNIFAGNNFKELLNKSQRASFLLVLNEAGSLDSVFIFKLKDYQPVESDLTNLVNHLLLARNILVVASSQSALDKIIEVKEGLIFSLASQINLKKMGRGLLTGYLDSANLKFYLNQKPNQVNKIFSQLFKQDIYLTFGWKNKQWQFKLISDEFFLSSTTEPLVTYLPKDFRVFVSSINLFEIFSHWGEVEPSFSDFFKQTSDNLQLVYNFNFAKIAESLLNQNSDLLIFSSQKETSLGFDYILLLPQVSEKQISDFQSLVKIILAQKLPKEINYLLPDGSKVTELLAETTWWQWQQDEAGINYLAEPALNFEISYFIKDNKLVIASNKELLQQFIANQDINLTELVAGCLNISKRHLLILNNKNIFSEFSNYLPAGIILIGEGKQGVEGCIVDL